VVNTRRWLAFDIAAAVGLPAVSAAQSDSIDLRWWVFAVPIVAGLLIQRRWPLAAVMLTVAGALGHHLPTPRAADLLDLAVPITLYTLAGADRPRRTAATTFGVLLAVAAGLSLLRPLLPVSMTPADETNIRVEAVPAPAGVTEAMTHGLVRGLGVLLVLTVAYMLGENTRGRRAHLHTLEQRAADLEREQRQRVALATAAERARITRELHDVVAHGLSVMVVQAQGGAAALRRHPDRTEAALRNVITTGRSSLAEMRRLLAVVRQHPVDDPDLAPQPGVDSLPELIDQVRAAGTPVTFAVEGDPVPLPASVDLSAYRITQEALTNTLKHAGDGASAAVRLGFHPGGLEIEVHDDGAGGLPPAKPPPADQTGGRPRADASGTGLRGISERVTILGGELTAGPQPSGGFRVLVRLPLCPEAAG
jgi:signal transduction histidine kinase